MQKEHKDRLDKLGAELEVTSKGVESKESETGATVAVGEVTYLATVTKSGKVIGKGSGKTKFDAYEEAISAAEGAKPTKPSSKKK